MLPRASVPHTSRISCRLQARQRQAAPVHLPTKQQQRAYCESHKHLQRKLELEEALRAQQGR